jgi:hypothetical protein
MNMLEVEARETLRIREKLNIDRDDLNQYLYYDDNLQISFDEYVTEKFEETLDLDFPIGTENLKKLMKDNGIWIEYLNKYFEDFYHDYKMKNDEEYNWKYTDHTPSDWEEYLSDFRSYL